MSSNQLLVLDCSFDQAFVGLFEVASKSVACVAELSCGAQNSLNESLLEGVDTLLQKSKNSLTEIDLFCAGVGPGSFTGIRVACSTAKAFAQVHQKNTQAFSSLHALAFSNKPASLDADQMQVARNAYQGMQFVGCYKNKQWLDQVFLAEQVSKEFNSLLNLKQGINGDGMTALFTEELKKNRKKFLEGIEPRLLAANYLRASQAEINLASRKTTKL